MQSSSADKQSCHLEKWKDQFDQFCILNTGSASISLEINVLTLAQFSLNQGAVHALPS